jgi:hypothetical protein
MSHWGGFKVALGWLWGAYQLATNRLCGGFDVALMSHEGGLRCPSAFFILPSTFAPAWLWVGNRLGNVACFGKAEIGFRLIGQVVEINAGSSEKGGIHPTKLGRKPDIGGKMWGKARNPWKNEVK